MVRRNFSGGSEMGKESRERILRILSKEDIRYIDGRYSKGFVDQEELRQMVVEGVVEIKTVQGFSFVKKSK